MSETDIYVCYLRTGTGRLQSEKRILDSGIEIKNYEFAPQDTS